MIKLISSLQAQSLRGRIPELALLRMTQFEGSDGLYDPAIHGHIAVVEEGDDPESGFPEFGEQGLLTNNEEWPLFDYVEVFVENGQILYEAVAHLDDERTLAIIIPLTPGLDLRLRTLLASYHPGGPELTPKSATP